MWASPRGAGSGYPLHLLGRFAACGDFAPIPDAGSFGLTSAMEATNALSELGDFS